MAGAKKTERTFVGKFTQSEFFRDRAAARDTRRE